MNTQITDNEISEVANYLRLVTGAEKASEFIGLAHTTPRWNETSIPHYNLENYLNENKELFTNNFFYSASCLDGGGRKKSNCIGTSSLVYDIDFGEIGHKVTGKYSSYKDYFNHKLINSIIEPSIIIDSGHGLHIVVELENKIDYANQNEHFRFVRLKHAMNSYFEGDTTESIEHLFRMPYSINCKKNIASVPCKFLKRTDKRYSLAELEGVFKDYLSDTDTGVNPPTNVSGPSPDFTLTEEDFEFGTLKDLSQMGISNHNAYSVLTSNTADRSLAFHISVHFLYTHRLSYNAIIKILRQNINFTSKYSYGRLEQEVLRSISKYNSFDDVDDYDVDLKPFNEVVEVIYG